MTMAAQLSLQQIGEMNAAIQTALLTTANPTSSQGLLVFVQKAILIGVNAALAGPGPAMPPPKPPGQKDD